MKKLLALLLATMMVFAIAACGGNDTPSGGGNTNNPSQSQNDDGGSGNDNDEGEEWGKKLYLTGLTSPEGSTVGYIGDKVRLQKDGGFTTEEKDALVKRIWDACMEVSPAGIYDVKGEFKDGSVVLTKVKEYSDVSEVLTDGWETGMVVWAFQNGGNYVKEIYIDFSTYENEILLEALEGGTANW